MSTWTGDVMAKIAGVASVIDGDTLEIEGRRIRLSGIDAPETGQSCEREGKRYPCGERAALAHSRKIVQSTVRCQQRGVDRYGRIIAVCRLGTEDLNAWMVREGWAVAYLQFSKDYLEDEKVARMKKVGVWSGHFVRPSKWRRGKRLQEANDRPSSQCLVKGNPKGERIYHMPGWRYYDRTRIDESKGERWFCSESEATAAGWRRALR